MRLNRYRTLLLMGLLLQVGACAGWRPVNASPREFIEEEEPDRIRIYRTDGTRRELVDPRIERDSLTARLPSAGEQDEAETESVRIALSEVALLEARRQASWGLIAISAGLTGFLVASLF